MVAKAEAATRQIEAAIEALSHDGFEFAIILTGGRCAGAFTKLARRWCLWGEERLPVSKNRIPGEAVPNTYTGKSGSRHD